MLERGPAHKYWAEALLAQKLQDDRRAQEGDLSWVIANWEAVRENPSQTVVTTLLKAAGALPDHTGFAMRGETGLAVLSTFHRYAALRPAFEAAMSQDDPAHALTELSRSLRTRTIPNQ